jgi:histidinol-phosphatase
VAAPGPSDLALAIDLADTADAIAVARFRAADLAVESKPDMTPVTEADRAVETAVRERLARARPNDVVVGEEFGAEEGGEARWIVDPIDGTKNYLRGNPVFATLLAVERDGEFVLGLASAPALGRRWWAVRGEGAFAADLRLWGRGARTSTRLQVSGVSRLGDAQLCFGGLRTWRKYGLLDRFLDLASRCWRTRGFGDFWMHMLVAEGAADAAAEMEVNLWDLAAVKVIVEEAGGRFTDLAGSADPSGGSAVTSNGLLHDQVLEILGGAQA